MMANVQKKSGVQQRCGGGSSRTEPLLFPHDDLRRCRRRRVMSLPVVSAAATAAAGSLVSRGTVAVQVAGVFLLSAAAGGGLVPAVGRVDAFQVGRDHYYPPPAGRSSMRRPRGGANRGVFELPTAQRSSSGLPPWVETSWGIGTTTSSLDANAPGGGGGPSPTGPGGMNSRQKQKTAIESAVLVEWEAVSELERRIEDGVYYDHFPDDEHIFGSEDAMRRRKKAAAARDARRGGGGGGGGGGNGSGSSGGERAGEEKDDADTERVQGVFCGFTVSKEEIERLRSANVDDSALRHVDTDGSSYSI